MKYSSTAKKRWTRRRFFAAAEAARCHIVVSEGLAIINHNGNRVCVWPDGVCTRGDVLLAYANRMTYRDAARVLNLE